MLTPKSLGARPGAASAPTYRRAIALRFGLPVALIALLGVTLWLVLSARPLLNPFAAAPVAFNGGVLEPPREVGALALSRPDGSRFTETNLQGRISLFFFGYMFCPDVCPTTMMELGEIRHQLGGAASAVDTYFVTVDPERDTPAVLAAYVAHHDPATIGLRGTEAETEGIKRSFGVVSERRFVPNSSLAYFVDHTAGIFLVDQNRSIHLVYPFGTEAADIAADIKHLLQK